MHSSPGRPSRSTAGSTRRDPTWRHGRTARLLTLVERHAGEGWADALLEEELGPAALEAIAALDAAVATSTALSRAREARATAHAPAYEGYLAFKRLVRDALGPGSKQYRRIHLRASPRPSVGAKSASSPAGAQER